MKDQLFLLKPGFVTDGGGRFYCGNSVAVEGLLGFFPELREKIDVHYLDYKKPREPIASWLGSENQSLPVLVLGEGLQGGVGELRPEQSANGREYFPREADIRKYLTIAYGLPTVA